MLTIKVIRPDKSEFLEEATSVFLNKPEQSQTGRDSVSYFPIRPDKEKQCIDIFEGTVYVMNGNGKTVANYFLSAPPQ